MKNQRHILLSLMPRKVKSTTMSSIMSPAGHVIQMMAILWLHVVTAAHISRRVLPPTVTGQSAAAVCIGISHGVIQEQK